MAVCRHGGILSTKKSTSNVQLACNEEWIAFPEKDKSFGICCHNALNEKVRKPRKMKGNGIKFWYFSLSKPALSI